MNKYINFFSGDSESIWATSGSFLRDKSSSEDEELAGPSQTVPPQLSVQHQEYSGPNERTALWHDSNKGKLSLHKF
uniref:Uncharacterized protein n=1 Tax=Canis lupus dingo TaxID=286419 RepID=A0A8C0R7K0_CANLU